MANTFKFGNGNWAVKDGYALAYNDENNNFKPLPFDFTRASLATRVNKQGLVETVPSGKPRIDFLDNTNGHLLLEPSRTNVLTYSEFTNADPDGWTLGFGTGTYDYDLVSYRGRGALKQTQTTIGRSYQYQNVTLLASTTYTLSMYVDVSNSNITNSGEDIMHVIADDDTGDNTAEWQDIDTNTGRVSITFTTGSDTSVQIRIGLGVTGNTLASNQVLIYSMPQLEAGSYATSYIPTEGSSVTRVLDEADQTGVQQVIGQSEGTLYLEFVPLDASALQILFQIRTTGSTNVGQIDLRLQSGAIRTLGSDGGSTQFSFSGGSYTVGTTYKVAVRYKTNDVKLYINGSSAGSDTACSFTSSTKQQISFSENVGTNFHALAEIKDARLYDTALTDTELQNLTS